MVWVAVVDFVALLISLMCERLKSVLNVGVERSVWYCSESGRIVCSHSLGKFRRWNL